MRMDEVDGGAVHVRVTRAAAFLEELLFFPERFAEAEHDLEDVSGLESGERPLLGRNRRIEAQRAGLEYGEWQGNDDGRRAAARLRDAVAAAAFHNHASAPPAHGFGDGAETYFRALRIQAVAQPPHDRVAAVSNAELFSLRSALPRERFGADAFGVRRVEAVDEVFHQAPLLRGHSSRLEIVTDGEILPALRDAARQIATHPIHRFPEFSHRGEPAAVRDLMRVRQFDDRKTGCPRDLQRFRL